MGLRAGFFGAGGAGGLGAWGRGRVAGVLRAGFLGQGAINWVLGILGRGLCGTEAFDCSLPTPWVAGWEVVIVARFYSIIPFLRRRPQTPKYAFRL